MAMRGFFKGSQDSRSSSSIRGPIYIIPPAYVWRDDIINASLHLPEVWNMDSPVEEELAELLSKAVLEYRRRGSVDEDLLKSFSEAISSYEKNRILREHLQLVIKSLREGNFEERSLLGKSIRMEGDELLLILPGSDEESAKRVMERIEKELKEMERTPPVEFSYGIAEVEGMDVLKAIEKADERMYSMKKSHHR